jgi:hypothetical protein
MGMGMEEAAVRNLWYCMIGTYAAAHLLLIAYGMARDPTSTLFPLDVCLFYPALPGLAWPGNGMVMAWYGMARDPTSTLFPLDVCLFYPALPCPARDETVLYSFSVAVLGF